MTTRNEKEDGPKQRGVFERPADSGVWWVRYVDETGLLHREKVGSKSLALKVYQKRKNEVQERRFFPERIRQRDVRLAEAIDSYMERTKGRLRRSVDFLRYAALWKKTLGHKTLRQLTPGDIERVAARRRSGELVWPPKASKYTKDRKPRPLAAATVNRELTYLRTVLYAAKADGKVGEIPFGKGSGKVKLYKESNQRVRYLTAEEEEALREAIGEDQWPKVAVGLYTGFRQANVFRLKWENVNFDTGVISAVETKSGDDYHVPMNDELRSILRALPSRLRSKWVFPSDGADTPVDAKNFMHRIFSKALTKAKIEKFRWHDLRHSFASRLVMAGVDLRTVQELMGHKTATMTLRYSHLSPEHKLDAVQKLNPKKPTGTTTDTSQGEQKAAGGASAQVIELEQEKDEPSRTRTGDPLLKRQML